jgi:alpha-D-ribose 1-methylphosphonate 5-triphosphate diphosphatase
MDIRNARIVTTDEEFIGSVRVEDGRFVEISRDGAPATAEDWGGDWLLPGLVELHTDNLEKHYSPRPGVTWPAIPAVVAHDSQLAASGITTVLDALAIGDASPRGTRREHFRNMLDAINDARRQGLLRVDHRLHLRCELSSGGVNEIFRELAADEGLALVSLMDHTPGQRQFTNLSKYREYYQGKYGLSDAEMEDYAALQLRNQTLYSDANRHAIVDHCRREGIALASHDDATPEHVAQAAGEGVVIAEFPTTLDAAEAAHSQGLAILMGAPNVVRGGSHSGNISALDLAREGLLDILSSDYVPASLLHSAFLVHEKAGWTLPDAVALVSHKPAMHSGLPDRGEVAPGKRADFLRVRVVGGVPNAIAVWRQGQRIF